eukprot:TRINITY_DN2811_c0_g1_i9.p1 TRINITY_DN2811_c0_g1~~TRINITY_DN2811_c0_g1_i9.p1  ORF type:complete len:236 (+),score=70.43 TRINITY_DN2811_c0_g1_i9:71-709(+)
MHSFIPPVRSVQLFVNDEMIEKIEFDDNEEGVITFDSNRIINNLDIGGVNTISMKLHSDVEVTMPCVINVMSRSYRSPFAESHVPICLTQEFEETTIAEGVTRQMTIIVSNESGDNTGMVVAIIGIPGGMALRHDRLKELIDGDEISYYEVRGRELMLYWEEMGVDTTNTVVIDLIAKIPGDYLAPASRAYAYYESENKHWLQEMEVKIEEH